MDDLYQSIQNGKYKTVVDDKHPAYHKPRTPAILSKPAGQLSEEELRSIPTVKAEHEAALQAHRDFWDAYRKEDSRLCGIFVDDLYAYFDVPKDDEFVQAMYSFAYEHGHSGGYSEVACAFSGLMPLWEVYHKANPPLDARVPKQRTPASKS